MTGRGSSQSWRSRTGATPTGHDKPRPSGPGGSAAELLRLAYGLGMSARKLPTPQDAATARRILLHGLARDADIFVMLSELMPLHPRNNTFPGAVFLRLAADALDWCGASREEPLALQGIRERFLPECTVPDGRTTSSSSPSWPRPRYAAEPSPISWTKSPGGKPTTSGNMPCSQRSPTSVPPPTGPVRPSARHASNWPSTRATQRHNYHISARH
jgi:hypothetical protein